MHSSSVPLHVLRYVSICKLQHKCAFVFSALRKWSYDETHVAAASAILYFHTRTRSGRRGVWHSPVDQISPRITDSSSPDTLQKCCTWIYGTWTPNPVGRLGFGKFGSVESVPWAGWSGSDQNEQRPLDTLYLSRANIGSHPSGRSASVVLLVKGSSPTAMCVVAIVWWLDWTGGSQIVPTLRAFQFLTPFRQVKPSSSIGNYHRSFGGSFLFDVIEVKLFDVIEWLNFDVNGFIGGNEFFKLGLTIFVFQHI